MDCPKCGASMSKDFSRSVDRYGEESIIVVWAAECPDCGYECDIEEEFTSTGWEQEV